MFELKNMKSLEDIVEQLSTVSDSITEESAFLPASIANTFKNLFTSIDTKEEANIVIDGITDEDLIDHLTLLSHYIPETLHINILVLGFNNFEKPKVGDNILVQTSKESLDQVMKRSREQRFTLHSIFLFNVDDKKLLNQLQNNLLQPYFRGMNTKLFICHNSDERETPRLLELKRYNIVEQKTFYNTFALDELETYIGQRISLVSCQNATRNPGFVEAEPTLKKMFNNTYFDKRFNSFGLHYKHEHEEETLCVIFFDYELCYDPFNYRVYAVNQGKFNLITEFSSDPFSILTRSLSDKVFHTNQPDAYISLSDKEHGAKLRQHFATILKCRMEAFHNESRNALQRNGIEITEERVALNAKNLGSGHPVRDATKADVHAFKTFHHAPETFVKEVKSKKSLYVAKDLFENELIFQLASDDNFNPQLIDFLHNMHDLDFDIHRLDADGYSMLDAAVTSGAVENAETLIRRGFNVNFANPFGFTALHRAYASGNEKGQAILTKHGAKITKNVFGQTPKDLAGVV